MSEEKPTWYENQLKRNLVYQRERAKSYTFRLYKANERDRHLMEVYEAIPNKAEFFRESIERYEHEHHLG